MKKLLIASQNKGKIKEIKRYLKDINNIETISLLDLNFNETIEETGTTYFQNAFIKAKAIYNLYSDYLILADDSGIEAKALNWKPGVNSRWHHPSGEDKQNLDLFLSDLKNHKDKSARFQAALVLYVNNKLFYTFDGTVQGTITGRPTGDHGFGYDPVFYVESLKKTMAEMSEQEKDQISHRGQALKKLKQCLIKEDF
ncbi:MAG: RdgB/HAM1 family non-canonical purine NTP pyrophosphatase [Erysipelotrichales bacterium]|nr:RdgB/HAM1 family non-canonical purine NTP pyrophosphatase [Erysipelotrichales bacterium]